MGGVGAAILEAHLFCCFAILEAHLDAVVGERLEGVESSCGSWSNIVFNIKFNIFFLKLIKTLS